MNELNEYERQQVERVLAEMRRLLDNFDYEVKRVDFDQTVCLDTRTITLKMSDGTRLTIMLSKEREGKA